MKKLALKRLTASDLTFFHWHYQHRRAGNQKAINLNSGIFVNQLYPAFPDAVRSLGGRAPLDMYLFGPGLAGPHNLQRKILRQQKNWRLNGEFVNNPDDAPERYNPLEPGDILVIEFSGDVVPTSAKLVFLAAALPEDHALQAAFDAELGTASMMTIGLTRIEEIVDQGAAPPDHPINDLLLDEALEDAVQGGFEGTRRLLSRPSGRQLTRENLLRSRRNADDIGRMGEELVNCRFAILRSRVRDKRL